MRILLSIFFLIFASAMLAQKFNNFFIEPVLSTKSYTALKNNINEPIETSYFKLTTKQTIAPHALFVGFNAGYKFKNKNIIQLGVAQDDISQGMNLYGISKLQNNNPKDFSTTRMSTFNGPACTNISLIYKTNILHVTSAHLKPRRYIDVYLNTGLTYFYKPNNGIEPLSDDYFNYLSIDSTYINVSIKPYIYPVNFKNSFKFNLGLDFTIGKDDKEWFNLNVSFITNRSRGAVYSLTNVQIDVSNKVDKKTYYYEVRGTGNGIYFALSKRIYPIKIYNKRMQKRIDKFQNKN